MPSEHVPAASLSLSESHPLSEELSSLHALVTRFQVKLINFRYVLNANPKGKQNEAHSSSIKLQRHALDTSAYSERIVQLEAENRLLHTELGVLRDNPASAKDKENDTVAELTLSLRRLNAKLSLTEAALAEHTRALEETTAFAAQQTHAASEAYALAARVRGREEEVRQREAGLEHALVQAREETRLTDRVVGEYAALVRKLEGEAVDIAWMEGGSTPTLVDPNPSPTPSALDPASVEESKAQLAAVVQTFSDQTSSLTSRIAVLESERDVAQAQLAASRTLVAELGDALATAKFEREKARVDDQSAAGMVERYMRFTQQTTTSLHASLAALRARHAATLETLHATVASLEQRLEGKERETTTLRTALDAAALDVLRESVGRRREVGLRVRMVGREERIRRALGAAVGRVRHVRFDVEDDSEANGHAAADAEAANKTLARLEGDVRAVLGMLDADVSVPPSSPSSASDPSPTANGHAQDHGTEGRMRVLEEAVGMLVRELEGEVARRVSAEREQGGRAWCGRGKGAVRQRKGAVRQRKGVGRGAAEEGRGATEEGRAAAEEARDEGLQDAHAAAPTSTSEPSADAASAPAEDRGDQEQRVGENEEVEDEGTTGEGTEGAGAGEPAVQERQLEEEEAQEGELELELEADATEAAGGAHEVEKIAEDEGSPLRAWSRRCRGDRERVEGAHGDVEPAPQIDTPSFHSDAAVTEDVLAQATPAQGEEVFAEEEVQPERGVPEAEREEAAQVGTAPDPLAPPSGDAATSATLPLTTTAQSPVVPASVAAPVALPSSDIDSTPAASPPSASASAVAFPGGSQTPSDSQPVVLPAHAEPSSTHPLLADLAAASSRYDALQLAFRECHLALQELRPLLANPTPTLVTKGQMHAASTLTLHAPRLPPNADVLRAAVERLYDYTEDARVELEIRVADGKVLARGWEAIGAFAARVDADGRGQGDGDDGVGGEGVAEDVRRQITRDAEAQAGFRRKLDDVEHDIAVVKRAVYAPDIEDSPPPIPISPAKAEGWTSWLGGGRRASGSTPPPGERDWDTDHAPTFGSVMTSPRLRHSSSAARLAGKAQGNPFELLGLRVPMPTYVPQQQLRAPATPPRQRTISGVYMLGLGVGHSPRERRPSGFAVPSPPPKGAGAGDEEEGDVE
ncbi:hypothetical protein MSAN_01085400 [Mycena sanguinolenta]|uniref:Uncharacterized protein n=1 Tax=Mycena sanguinolenta TaxID=230812 RepID=A0A8H7DA33_9AGAR|nr:hypothetical protein MSAN_01085400 [Mycena sanguinolenta]